MSTAHTPGPWSVLEHKGVFVLAQGGLTVAEVTYMLPDAKGETRRLANASLLAAAPELLAALKQATALLRAHASAEDMGGERFDLTDCPPMKSIFAAIAKATGEQA